MHQTFKQTVSLIKSDFQARAEFEYKELSFFRVLRFLTKSCVLPVLIYRVQMFFYHHHMRIIASLLKFFNSLVFSVRIDSKACIGPRLIIFHSSSIFIGPNVSIGSDCHITHQNTITPSSFYQHDNDDFLEGPTIGDHVLLGCGASVVGNITLGNHVKVSINSTVDKSFPDNAVLIGVPARNVAKPEGS